MRGGFAVTPTLFALGLLACNSGLDTDTAPFVDTGERPFCLRTDPEPVPVCERPASSDPNAVVAGTLACTDHDDCAAEEFCGAGYCRLSDAEYATVCIEEAAFSGPQWIEDGNAPLLAATITDDDVYYTVIHTDEVGACQPDWNRCERWPINQITSLSVRDYSSKYESQYFSPYVFRQPIAPFAATQVGVDAAAVGRLVDGGCIRYDETNELHDFESGDPPGFDVVVWISVWYP